MITPTRNILFAFRVDVILESKTIRKQSKVEAIVFEMSAPEHNE
jgi:hypothetical protein